MMAGDNHPGHLQEHRWNMLQGTKLIRAKQYPSGGGTDAAIQRSEYPNVSTERRYAYKM